MLWMLVKKQLYDIFKGYFYNAKKNKARSKAGTVLWFVFFAVLMIGLLGGMFFGLSYVLSEPLAKADLSWLFYALMEMIAVMLGVFGSVFNTYASLYLAKDNDLLLSMPIPINYIVASRLINVYLMGLMYSSVVIVPAIIAHLVFVEAGIMPLIGGLVVWLEISAICFILSCFLGWVVAQVSLRLKYKSLVTVFASLVFIGLYYFFYFKAADFLQAMLMNIVTYGKTIKNYAYPLYMWGSAALGDPVYLLISIGIAVVLMAMTWIMMAKSFLKTVTATGAVAKNVYKEKKAKERSISGTLFAKELNRFTSSSNYMLNCGLGILIMPLMGVVLLVKGKTFLGLIPPFLTSKLSYIIIIVPAIVGLMAAMNDMAAPSISLEGKNIWIVQSLPIKPWKVLQAKLRFQITLTVIPALILWCCTLPFMNGSIVQIGLGLAVIVLEIVLSAHSCLFIGLKMPNLNWTNEIAPIKQSLGVVLAMLASALVPAAYAGLFIWQGWKIGILPYEIIAVCVLLALCIILNVYLRTKGEKDFMDL